MMTNNYFNHFATTSQINVAHPNTTQSRVAYTPSSSSDGYSCTLCKILGQKCDADCLLLAPYFPPFDVEKQKQAINALNLFGRERIIETLKIVDSKYHYDAITAITYTADARARDPVGGCKRMINTLLANLALYYDQLHDVRAKLAACRGDPPINKATSRPPFLIGDDLGQASQALLNILPLPRPVHYSSGQISYDGVGDLFEIGPEPKRRRFI